MSRAVVFGKRPFDKDVLALQEQVDLLKRRGLSIPGEDRAKSYLQTIGYYRLSGYFRSFQMPDYVPPEDGIEHPFRHGTTFDDILNLYVSDRKLRLLMVDALERIEVAVRVLISNTMCVRRDNAFWFMDTENFRSGYLHSPRGYRYFIKQVEANTRNGTSEACTHYHETYSEPEHPPSWIVIESLTMGVWSKLYDGLKKPDQKNIAKYTPFDKKHFGDWIYVLTLYRNACAHHERIWNRVFSRQAPEVGRYAYKEKENFGNTPYAKFVVTYAFLKAINQKSNWPIRLKALMDDWPLDIHTHMGFPKDWHTLPFWQVPPK